LSLDHFRRESHCHMWCTRWFLIRSFQTRSTSSSALSPGISPRMFLQPCQHQSLLAPHTLRVQYNMDNIMSSMQRRRKGEKRNNTPGIISDRILGLESYQRPRLPLPSPSRPKYFSLGFVKTFIFPTAGQQSQSYLIVSNTA